MRKNRLVAGVPATAAQSLIGGILLLLPPTLCRAQEFGPVPPPPLPPNIVSLSPVEQLGKFMLYDSTLSNPKGYACASCHVPQTGFTGPSSEINQFTGPMPGVVPGRAGPQALLLQLCRVQPRRPVFRREPAGVDRRPILGRPRLQPGRAVQGPPINPNEMDNTPAGTAPHQFSPLLAHKLAKRPYTPLFKNVFGADAFTIFTPQEIYVLFSEAVAAYESSPEILSFSSKFDSWIAGKYKPTAAERRGMSLYYGKAQCFQCHSSLNFPDLQLGTDGREVFTMYCFANIGVPKNPNNPFYNNTDPSNPGFNPLGTKFIDFGLGSNAVGAPDGTKFFNKTPGDIAQFRGLFLTPTTPTRASGRNRPS